MASVLAQPALAYRAASVPRGHVQCELACSPFSSCSLSQPATGKRSPLRKKRAARDHLVPRLLALLILRGSQEERSFASSMENAARSVRLHVRLTNVSSTRLP